MNIVLNEKDLLELQIIASIVFIITISISIILTINNINKLNNNSFINADFENTISLCNRIIITLISILFSYISYCYFKRSSYLNKEISNRDFFASLLSLASSLIILYNAYLRLLNEKQNANQSFA